MLEARNKSREFRPSILVGVTSCHPRAASNLVSNISLLASCFLSLLTNLLLLVSNLLLLNNWYLCLNRTPSRNPKKSGKTNWTPCPTRSCAKKEQNDPSLVPIRSIRKQASIPARAVATPFFTPTSSTIAAADGRVSPSPSDQKPLMSKWTTATSWFEKKSFVLPVGDT